MTGAASAQDHRLVLLAPYGAGLWSQIIPAVAKIATVTVVDPGDEDDFAAMAERIVRVLPARFHLVGFCLGGHIALEILRKAPGQVAGLALLNTGLAPDSPTQRVVREERIAKLRAKASGMETPDDGYISHAAQWLVSPRAAASPSLMAQVRALLGEIPLSRSIAQQRAMLGRSDNRQSLTLAQAPVLAVGGDHDRVCPPTSVEAVRSYAPGARVHVLQGCGHLSPLERPAGLAAVLTGWLMGRASDTLDASRFLEQTT
jgi:pimeloyl-ACP methyl ester carboxylesterase